MTDRSKWVDWAAAAAVLVTVSSLVWSAATITAASANLSGNFDQFKRAVSAQISAVQTQIASLPTQGVRLDQVEHGLSEMRQDNAAQNADINLLKQGVAVLNTTMDGMRHDMQMLQDAANGRLPNGRAR